MAFPINNDSIAIAMLLDTTANFDIPIASNRKDPQFFVENFLFECSTAA